MEEIRRILGAISSFLDFHLISLEHFNLTLSDIIVLIFILIAARFVFRAVKLLAIRRLSQHQVMDAGRVNSVALLVKYVIYLLAVLLGLQTIGINVSILLASSAALLVGVGLALQQFFYDIVGGVIILYEGIIQVGDIVEVKDLVGEVKDINLRTSKIETRQGYYIIVPNSKFISGDVTNWSHITKATRFEVKVGVAYGSDVQLVKRILLEVAERHEALVKSPKPFVRFTDFGDSALMFELLFWTEQTFTVENIKSDIRFDIDAAFREHKVQIPFPQRDLHIKTPIDLAGKQ